jgi:hypothetical protein
LHARRHLLSRILENFAGSDVIVDSYDLDITCKKIECMRDGEWLNSEVITWWLEWWRERTGGGSQKVCVYACVCVCVCMCVCVNVCVCVCARARAFALTQLRAQLKPEGKEGIGKNWFANTYFYTKLREDGQYNYKNVRRWTKKIDIFECDKMIIPINVRMYVRINVRIYDGFKCTFGCGHQCTYARGWVCMYTCPEDHAHQRLWNSLSRPACPCCSRSAPMRRARWSHADRSPVWRLDPT